MVNRSSGHVWSSYRHNAGQAMDALVELHRLYRALGIAEEARVGAYQALVQAPMNVEMLKTI